jgi:hypothetical protein
LAHSELSETLREGTRHVLDLVAGRVTFQEFDERYESFYYRESIDGFDCPSDWREELARLPELVQLHREVEEIVDRSYCLDGSVSAEAYRAAGRLSPDEAREAIVRVVERVGVERLLDLLTSA